MIFTSVIAGQRQTSVRSHFERLLMLDAESSKLPSDEGTAQEGPEMARSIDTSTA